jgi:hypothetical protein
VTPPFTYKTVTASYKSPDGTNVTGSVRFIPSETVTDTDGNLIVARTPLTVALSSGALSIALLVTDDADTTPTGWVWQVAELFSGGREWEFELPSASPSVVDLSDLTPATTATPVSSYASTATVAAIDTRLTSAEVDLAATLAAGVIHPFLFPN